MRFPFDNSYARDLPDFYVPCQPAPAPVPQLLFFNDSLAAELDLQPAASDEENRETLAQIFSGNRLPEAATPIAQAYAGHQFGNFSPKLGDGRALLIGEVIDRAGRRRDIAFKGSGRTAFSRSGDGKAAVGPMLREVLIGEAMHALGIPTTRALAVVATGEPVYRTTALPGAVLTRVAASHIRVGTFQFYAARGAQTKVQQLADYTIARHYPELAEAPDRNLQLLRLVMERQAALVAQWMSVGFIHGVMNTDNVSISGETIDFGPCAFMEMYDPQAVFSSIDEHGRYAYQNQPPIAQWNLARFAETLLPLIAYDADQAVAIATGVIEAFDGIYQLQWRSRMRDKLGLHSHAAKDDRADIELSDEWLALLQSNKIDFTLGWRKLANAAQGDVSALSDLFYDRPAFDAWLRKWQARCAAEPIDAATRAMAMREVNPWIIPRNHLVEEALAAASDHGNVAPFEQLLAAIRQPYEENPVFSRFAMPAPESFTTDYRTFCGT